MAALKFYEIYLQLLRERYFVLMNDISSNVSVSILDGVVFQGCQREFSMNG